MMSNRKFKGFHLGLEIKGSEIVILTMNSMSDDEADNEFDVTISIRPQILLSLIHI